jgi:two-component system, response regulator PdtaR
MSRLRVLIVEDDIIYAETVKILLERERHTVVGIAAHASEVRALTRAQHPDLALVDLHLNDGCTGADIGRGLASAGVNVLFLTGTPERAPRDLRGVMAVLAKPAGDARLLRAVEAVIAAIRCEDPRRA